MLIQETLSADGDSTNSFSGSDVLNEPHSGGNTAMQVLFFFNNTRALEGRNAVANRDSFDASIEAKSKTKTHDWCIVSEFSGTRGVISTIVCQNVEYRVKLNKKGRADAVVIAEL